MPNLCVVLVRTKFPENIGSAARAMANMGLNDLRLAGPERLWPEPMARLASTGGAPVLEALRVYEDLAAATADCALAVATTARTGRRRGRLTSPRQAAPAILDWAARGRVALVFGPEDRGLDTNEVDACGLTVCIPTAAAYSLNLAQAVLVLTYEIFNAALAQRRGEDDDPAGVVAAAASPRPASLAELDGLKQHLKQALVALGAIPADNPDHFFRPFKATLERAGVTSREARAWRGLARQALWLAGQIEDKD
ncbi:MAG: TrmH family RNA methyltransferase [Pseudomonadota bacterium]